MRRKRGWKAEKIRECKAANPNATDGEIVTLLAAEGVKVTYSSVASALKSHDGKHNGNGSPARMQHGCEPLPDLSLARNVLAAERFTNRLGGVEQARRAIDCYEAAALEA